MMDVETVVRDPFVRVPVAIPILDPGNSFSYTCPRQLLLPNQILYLPILRVEYDGTAQCHYSSLSRYVALANAPGGYLQCGVFADAIHTILSIRRRNSRNTFKR